MIWGAFILVAFLSGSVPFGLLIARARHLDIRQHGSRNIGATNVGRVLGRKWGILCLVLDALKAFIPTAGAGLWFGLWGRLNPSAPETLLWMAVLIAAVLGHIFSPWVGFKGGKGVASSLGAMLGFFPLLTFPALGALAIFILVLRTWRYVSLASCLAALSIPILASVTPAILARVGGGDAAPAFPWPVVACSGALAMLVIYRHRSNIARLRSGTEPRIGHRPARS
jgi:glycerol-3-phosphate acyltransferase PlsY